MKSKPSPKLISLTFSILVICFAIGFYVLSWTEPTSSPPAGNVPAPINVSSTSQTKAGNLTLANLYLNATANEGNVERISNLIGYNDIFIKGNSSETAPVYLGGNQISLYTSSTERVRVDSSGNVGIGTASPTQKLHVVGNTRITGLTNCDTIDTDASGNLTCGTDAAGGGAQNVFLTINAPSGTDPVADSTTDTLNLSAGSGITITGDATTDTVTIAPDTNYLQRRVTGTCVAGSSIRVINVDGTVTCETDDVGAAGLWTDQGTYIYPNNYNQFSITDTGNVGIGTTAPTYKLDVVGDIGLNQYLYHNDDTDTYFNFEDDRLRAYIGSEYLLDLYEGTQDYVKLGDGGDVDINLNDDMFIQGSNGYVGIGTISPMSNLHIAGNIRVTGLVNCNTIDADGSGNLVCGADEGATYTAGEGINISGNTVSIKAPTSTTKGGVLSKTCSSGQAVTQVDTSGNINCGLVEQGLGDSYIATCRAQLCAACYGEASCEMECKPDYEIRSVQVTSKSTYAYPGWLMSDARTVRGSVNAGSGNLGQWVEYRATCVKEEDPYPVTCRAQLCLACYGEESCYLECEVGYGVENIQVTSKSTYAYPEWTMSDAQTVSASVNAGSGNLGQWVEYSGSCVKQKSSYIVNCRAQLCLDCTGTTSCYMHCNSGYSISNVSVPEKSTYASTSSSQIDSDTVKGTVTSATYKGQWAKFQATCTK